MCCRPFPTIYIPDRERNKVFIADYAFNEFAAGPLVLRPLEWRNQGRAAEVADSPAEEREVKDGGEVQLAEETEELTGTKPDEDPEEKQDDPQGKETEDHNAFGSLGSQSMDIENDSENTGGFHITNKPAHSSSPPTGEAAAIHRPQEPAPAESDEGPVSFKIRKPTSNIGTGLPPSPNTTPQSQECSNHILLTEVLPGAAVAPTTTATETLDCGTVDWEDAFD